MSKADPEIVKRLRILADEAGGPSALARALGIDPQTMSNYLAGRSNPGNKMQARLRGAGYDVGWLMTGRRTGSQVKEEYRVALEYRVEATVPAGIGEYFDRTDSWETETIDYDPDVHRWLHVSHVNGESMRPLIEPGDSVLITDREKIKPGDLVAARWKGTAHGAIKLYDEDGDNVILYSYNNQQKPIMLPKDSVKLYRVVILKKRRR